MNYGKSCQQIFEILGVSRFWVFKLTKLTSGSHELSSKIFMKTVFQNLIQLFFGKAVRASIKLFGGDYRST